jgi:two-component system cell cycle response regulator
MSNRILLIEDNPASLDLMSYLLTAFGYAPFTAHNGAEGLEAARRQPPDLIICDVQMPVMDGYEVAQRLKTDTDLRTIPLVVTALAMVGDRDKVLAAGFDGYIAKPINPETFVRQLEVYLRTSPHTATLAPGTAGAVISAPLAIRGTILVVDNLHVNLDLARSILEPHGYRVITAEGPVKALVLAQQIAFDLILSDVCMAEASGYEFIQQIKADPKLRAIPFVFVTATMLDAQDRAHGLALGAARFLTRPIEPQVLLAEIEACLRQKESV